MSMRKIREVLRLTHELGLSVRQVREATGVGKTAVSEYVSRARVIGITWPIPPEITDAELERRLFTPAGFHEGSTKPLPDWTKVHEELKRRGVTLMILWEEHRAAYVDGHGYSRYVAAKIMLRLPGRVRDTADFPGSIRNIERGSLGSTRPSEMPSVTATSVAEADLSSR